MDYALLSAIAKNRFGVEERVLYEGYNFYDEYRLVGVDKTCYLYEKDKTTKKFAVGKGDTLMAIRFDGSEEWIRVLTNGSGGNDMGYIRIENLRKNKKGEIISGKFRFYDNYVFFRDSEKSHPIYSKLDTKSKKIGVMRKNITLPEASGLSTDEMVAVFTMDGIGYVVPEGYIVEHVDY